MSNCRHICIFLTCVALLSMGAVADDTAQVEFFEKNIRPVLIAKCYECHAKDAKGGLRLDSRDAGRKGGDSGPAIVPGDVGSSILLSAIKYEDLEMPPSGQLPPKVIEDFSKWIALGAVDPRDTPEAISSESVPKKTIDLEKARQAWPFQPPKRHSIPDVSNQGWTRNRIDYFILHRLEARGLSISSQADRRTLIRRLSYDLTGLPPSSDQIDRFVTDPSPQAYSALVDRLLSSPGFGERWARMWLDVARYAEDQAHIVGNDQTLFYPNAYYYRDWVINAFNSDMPYDRFVSLQLAGDLLSADNTHEHVALGFIGLGPKYYNRGRLEVKADEWEDRVDTVSRGLLGLTVACARCHDHKFDPISMEDYYGLAGIFASTEMFNRPLLENGKSKKGQTKKPNESVHIVRDGKPTDLNVFIRGNVERKGPVIKRRFPLVVCSSEPAEIKHGSGRLELARAIVDPQNPLTARVFVNRIFGQLTGSPIVASPSNFGKLGHIPTHPDLLDDLAVGFMDNAWSMKWLIRQIVQSATYRQSSLCTQEQSAKDPDNQWLGRMNRRRLSVEQWRDTLLAIGDRLEARVGGPSIDIQDAQERRRTVYSSVSRFQLKPMLVLFDFPDANVHAAIRSETTTPLQKLFVMNSPFLVDQAVRLAENDAIHPSDTGVGDRIIRLYRHVFGRLPSEEELRLGFQFVQNSAPDSVETWQHYVHALLASNELLFVD